MRGAFIQQQRINAESGSENESVLRIKRANKQEQAVNTNKNGNIWPIVR